MTEKLSAFVENRSNPGSKFTRSDVSRRWSALSRVSSFFCGPVSSLVVAVVVLVLLAVDFGGGGGVGVVGGGLGGALRRLACRSGFSISTNGLL